MLAYHYTSLERWEQIRDSGVIRRGKSHVNPHKDVGPEIVWLSTSEDPDTLGLSPKGWSTELADFDQIDRTRVRITVEVNRTSTPRFTDFAQRYNAPPGWMAMLRKRLGSLAGWRVHTREIPREQWVEVLDTETGQPLSMVAAIGQGTAQPVTTTTGEAGQ